MADIRIKDLTTTASSTASDDFIAVDGTTNGTRKLSAFSPTFGGNATVTGTLTANNTFTATGGMVSTYGTAPQFSITPSGGRPIRFNASLGNISIQANSGGWYLGTHFLGSAGTHRGSIWASGTDDSLDFISIGDGSFSQWLSTSSTKIAIPLTTASTTTSSGALVVGNGTSGGLGVGGAASIGGPILVGTSSDVYLSRVGAGILDIRSASSPGTAARLDVTGTTSAGLGLRQTGTRDWFISAESSELRVSCLTAASIFAFNSGTPVAMRDTTASTSTSSGALVVSGGVGVAGNIWTGGQVNLAATSVEASTGINFGVALAASRDIVFFGDGTRGGMLRGYHDGSNIARLGFGYWASSGDTYTSVIDITGSATTSSQLVAIAGTAGSTSTTSGALTVAGGMGVAEAVNAGTFYGLVDGVTAPATGAGYARIYVDSADGDLKVKFGDGTVKTIATDS